MRKLFCSAVIVLVSFVPWLHGRNTAVTVAPNTAVTVAPTQMVPVALVIPMPEPFSPALLAVDLLCVGVLVVLLRRRASGTNR